MKTWKKHLRSNYRDFNEWQRYSETYGLAARLGYTSEKLAWVDNPLIQGSTQPQDFSLVPLAVRFWLPRGLSGFWDDAGRWICTGAQMGRPNTLPAHPESPCQLRLTRLPFVDGDYDRWGAYWGSPATVWCAWHPSDKVRVFVRAQSRAEAKTAVKQHVPGARFYR